MARVDVAPFLTTLAVMIEDFCKASWPAEAPPGPQAALRRSEGLTVAICGQEQECGRERGVDRSAQRHLRAACPSLPARPQWHRPLRSHQPARVLGVLPLG